MTPARKTFTYDCPGTPDRKSDGWDWSWCWCRPSERSSLPRTKYTASSGRQTPRCDRNTSPPAYTSFDTRPGSYCWRCPLRTARRVSCSPPSRKSQDRRTCAPHLNKCSPGNQNSDHLPSTLDACAWWIDSMNNFAWSRRSLRIGRRMRTRSGTCPRNLTDWPLSFLSHPRRGALASFGDVAQRRISGWDIHVLVDSLNGDTILH